MNMNGAIDTTTARTDLIPVSVPGFAVFLLAMVAVLLWAGARYLTKRERERLPWYGVIGPRVGTAIVAAWCCMQLLGRWCELSGPWPIWLAAAITGFSIEGAASRYQYERRPISERLGLALTLMRSLALLLLVVVLLQPVRVWSTDRHIARRVAVLVDDSESMHFTDEQWTKGEMAEMGLQADLLDPKEWPLPVQAEGAGAGTNLSASADSAWDALPLDRRESIRRYCATNRFALAAAVLAHPPEGGKSLLDRLAGRYDLYLARMGDGLELTQSEYIERAAALPDGETSEGKDSVPENEMDRAPPTSGDLALRSLTDYPTALEKIIKDIPSEELAGVLIVSDGRNNGAAGLEPIARRLGLQDVPVCGIVVGGTRLPRDVAIAEVQAPESIFLGDRVRMRVTVRVTGAKGSKINLMMSGASSEGGAGVSVPTSDGEVVLDKALIDVLTDDYTREVRLTHEPKEHGLRSYSLWTETLDDELFTTNNTWKVDVAVSDDRTNVLLVDDRPRWEFRYLRNLFYGRDKSVHLQYFLVNPDKVEGGTYDASYPPASASREFGDAEAGALPVSRDEWRKFGMIVIGDVDADTLTTDVLDNIRHCVSERGAMLVVIAGRRHMPHSFDDEVLRELLPVRYGAGAGSAASVARLRARLVLTGTGGSHPVMQQSGSYSENAAIWDEMMPVTWRCQVSGVKPGAEVLAYAQSEEKLAEDPVDVAAVASRLDEETSRRTRNSLIVAQDYGRGKVLMLNFDQTWRLRHKVGDTLHHKFWGQVMRWGVGEKLRAGSEGLRLGTDRLIYTPREAPRVLARVTDSNSVGVVNAQLDVVVTRGDVEVARVTPVYRDGSHGMYEVALPPCAELGRYELVMTRKDPGHEAEVQTAFMVVTAKRSIEFSDVTATREHLDLLARSTGGRVVGPARAHELWDAFGEGGTVVAERHERTLWDRPWVLICLLGFLTTEWVLRKRGGLT